MICGGREGSMRREATTGIIKPAAGDMGACVLPLDGRQRPAKRFDLEILRGASPPGLRGGLSGDEGHADVERFDGLGNGVARCSEHLGFIRICWRPGDWRKRRIASGTRGDNGRMVSAEARSGFGQGLFQYPEIFTVLDAFAKVFPTHGINWPGDD